MLPVLPITSIYNYSYYTNRFLKKCHEPWWFLLRRTSAIILVLAVIAYGYVQLLNLVSFVKSPNIVTLESKKGGGFPGK